MKIAVIGAGGVRTPMIVRAMGKRQDPLGLTELALMDIDAQRLDLIGGLLQPLERSSQLKFKVTRTTDPRLALKDADYVITTFRVGGIESRVIDEKVPLSLGVLGQETTGPGGFAMAMRTIPVLLDYVELMRELCPNAWLINFANPAGLLAEALIRVAKWKRSVGICDGPESMRRMASMLMGVPDSELTMDYFGLNHLGWIRSMYFKGQDVLPSFLNASDKLAAIPEFPFEPALVQQMGMIPNEYLYYYYSNHTAVQNILKSEETRGEYIARLNNQLFSDLGKAMASKDVEKMEQIHQAYMRSRWEKYMAAETDRDSNAGRSEMPFEEELLGGGYAGVALGVIEALQGGEQRYMILNVRNNWAIPQMDADDVVEIPVYVQQNAMLPQVVGAIPDHPLGLMKQVKAYERLTIEAAVEGSYQKAWQALVIHPLVRDAVLARKILDGYIQQHGDTFPKLR